MKQLGKGYKEGGISRKNGYFFFTFLEKRGGGTKVYTEIYNLLAKSFEPVFIHSLLEPEPESSRADVSSVDSSGTHANDSAQYNP